MIKERNGDIALRVCDSCGHEQWVNYWNLVKKQKHLCRFCANAENGEKKQGQRPWNKGKKQEPKSLGNWYLNSSGYAEVWVGKHQEENTISGYRREHRLVAEILLGRKLEDEEIVHHIDGDKLNNLDYNLYVCEDQKHHRNVHGQLERVAMDLVKSGAIKFEPVSGQYFIDPYVREFISKSLELLENPEKGNQQRSLRELEEEERSTTIQKWSTLQAIGSGSGGHPTEVEDDDIVCSA